MDFILERIFVIKPGLNRAAANRKNKKPGITGMNIPSIPIETSTAAILYLLPENFLISFHNGLDFWENVVGKFLFSMLYSYD